MKRFTQVMQDMQYYKGSLKLVLIWDGDWKAVSVNRFEFLQYKPEEIIYKNY